MNVDRKTQRKAALQKSYDSVLFIAMVFFLYCGLFNRKQGEVGKRNSGADYGILLNKTLPSLNVFDYELHPRFPIFKAYPRGIPRHMMPQFDRSSQEWSKFESMVRRKQGKIQEELVDLREVYPMQAELSGFISYNLIFGDAGKLFTEAVKNNPTFVEDSVIVLRTKVPLKSLSGEIPKGALLVLDGHHTTAAALLCAGQKQNVRRANSSSGMCFGQYSTRRSLQVISGLHPLTVRRLALRAGNEGRQRMIPSRPYRNFVKGPVKLASADYNQ